MAKIPTAFESGFGQQVVKAQPTPFQNLSTNTDMFGGALARTAGQGAKALAQAGEALFIRQQQIAEATDKAAVSRALSAARDDAEKQSLNLLYAQPPEDMFANGVAPGKVYEESSKIYDRSQKAVAGMLANPRQQQMFSDRWGVYAASENGRASTYIGNQFRNYTKIVSDEAEIDSKSALGSMTSQIEEDYRNADRVQSKGHVQIESSAELGLSRKAADEMAAEWDDIAVPKAVVRGWFSEQPDKIDAINQILTGNINDPTVQSRYSKLDAKERKVLRNDLISQAQKVAQLKKDSYDSRDVQLQAQADSAVQDYYTSTDPVERDRIYESLKGNSRVSTPVLKDMADNQVRGPVIRDVQEGIAILIEGIETGVYTTIADINAFRYKGAPVATASTMATRLYPMVSAKRDKQINVALRASKAELGLVMGGVTSATATARAAQFEARFLRAMADQSSPTKNADPWVIADRLVKEIRKEFLADPKQIRSLTQRWNGYNRVRDATYDDPVKKANDLANALRAFNNKLQQMGVSQVEAKENGWLP